MSLPPQIRFTALKQLAAIDVFDTQVAAFDERLTELFDETEPIRLLRTMPGIGFVLGILVSLEVGDVGRFGSPGKLASYAGTVPRVHSSGGKTRYGRLRNDVNRYLKWAFVSDGEEMTPANRVRIRELDPSDTYDQKLLLTNALSEMTRFGICQWETSPHAGLPVRSPASGGIARRHNYARHTSTPHWAWSGRVDLFFSHESLVRILESNT